MRARRALFAALLVAACGRHEAPCSPGGGGYLAKMPAKLSQLCLFDAQNGELEPRPGVVPYDLNTPLFSDYALKTRMVWLPPGTHASYDPKDAFDLPVGALVAKTFGFAPDLRTPGENVRLVETRILVRTAAGWKGWPYVWDADQQDATLTPAGGIVPLAFTSASGEAVHAEYLIPNVNQCKKCHADAADGESHLLGPSARQLNRDFAYADGTENELAHWSRLGILEGAPPPQQAPRLAVWNDPATGTVAERARAYLDANCGHCHNPGGPARVSGLFLRADVTEPYRYGVCKSPVAAGNGSGGYQYDVVPGDPGHSILPYRLASTDPKVMMPELGRSVVHEEGLALIREWIASLSGGCP